MKSIRIIAQLILVVFLGACVKQGQKSDLVKQYFDIKQLLDSSIKQMEQLPIKIDKTVYLNEKHEQKTIDKPNIANEFELFAEADINIAAYLGQYQTDTVMGNAVYSVVYKPSKDKFVVRALKIDFDKATGKIKSIYFETERKNPLYHISGAGKLIFDSVGSAYVPIIWKYNGHRKIVFFDEVRFGADAQIVN